MPLNKQTGNMFPDVDSTWNPIKGICPHDCAYCYAKGINNYMPRLDEKEFKTDLKGNSTIFIGSSIDMFADKIPHAWIEKVIEYALCFPSNNYMFLTKNPKRYQEFKKLDNISIRKGVTIESNIYYKQIMRNAPLISERIVEGINFISIEPIMNFTNMLFKIIIGMLPDKIYIGANTSGFKLIEPSKYSVLKLIDKLSNTIYNVVIKDNLKERYGIK